MMILRGMQLNKTEQELNKFAYNLCGKKKKLLASCRYCSSRRHCFSKETVFIMGGRYLHAGSVPCSKELTTLLFANTGFTQVVLKREEVGQAEL